MEEFIFDEVGPWSEKKLEILKKYSEAYSLILKNQRNLKHGFIDGFAGEGYHFSRETGVLIPGSPMIAHFLKTPFEEIHLVDRSEQKTKQLQKLTEGGKSISVHHGDSNEILISHIFPQFRFEDYKRAFCFLDPYGMTLDWKVIAEAGKLKSIDLLINFPTHDIQRNILLKEANRVSEINESRLNALWGDESWKESAFRERTNLFHEVDPITERDTQAIKKLVSAFKSRLKKEAGFKYVVEPLPLINSVGHALFYLFFASQNQTAEKIAKDIFKLYRA